MVRRVLRFVRLPLLLVLLFTVGRFMLGASGFPYAPRGTSIFSIVTLTFISCFYFGALSKRAGFTWGGTALTGYSIGLFAQILIFLATWLSFAAGIETSYFRHWDALQVPEGTVVDLMSAMQVRLGGVVFGPIPPVVLALIGRTASALAPETAPPSA